MNFGARAWLIALLLVCIPFSAAQPNETVLVSIDSITNPVGNHTPISPPKNTLEQQALDQNCVQTWECRQFAEGQHYYQCTYDPGAKQCRCYTGPIERCSNPDLRCAFEHECQASTTSPGYNYDCTFDKDENECRCFTGDFARCRLEVSDPEKVVFPGSEVEPPEEIISPAPEESVPTEPPASPSYPFALIGGIVVAIIALLLLFAVIRRETPQKHLAAARDLHKRAEEAHERGEEDEAKELMKEADRRRRRAFALKRTK